MIIPAKSRLPLPWRSITTTGPSYRELGDHVSHGLGTTGLENRLRAVEKHDRVRGAAPRTRPRAKHVCDVGAARGDRQWMAENHGVHVTGLPPSSAVQAKRASERYPPPPRTSDFRWRIGSTKRREDRGAFDHLSRSSARGIVVDKHISDEDIGRQARRTMAVCACLQE